MRKYRSLKLIYIIFVVSLPLTLAFLVINLFRLGISPEYPWTIVFPILTTVSLIYIASLLFKSKKVLGILTIYIFYISLSFFTLESYFTPAPDIGTTFSEKFSWERYESIKNGMTKFEVDNLLGTPLLTDHYSSTTLKGKCFSYSKDGSGIPLDLAWIYTGVCFDENAIVVDKRRDVIHD